MYTQILMQTYQMWELENMEKRPTIPHRTNFKSFQTHFYSLQCNWETPVLLLPGSLDHEHWACSLIHQGIRFRSQSGTRLTDCMEPRLRQGQWWRTVRTQTVDWVRARNSWPDKSNKEIDVWILDVLKLVLSQYNSRTTRQGESKCTNNQQNYTVTLHTKTPNERFVIQMNLLCLLLNVTKKSANERLCGLEHTFAKAF